MSLLIGGALSACRARAIDGEPCPVLLTAVVNLDREAMVRRVAAHAARLARAVELVDRTSQKGWTNQWMTHVDQIDR